MFVFSWKSWYHGTMVPSPYLPPYLPPAYPLPTTSLWGGEIVVFWAKSKKWARIRWTWKKRFFRVNPLFPPSRSADPLKKRLWGESNKLQKK